MNPREFVGYLKWLLEESENGRAAMVNLRRGLGKPPGSVYETDRYVLSKLPENASTHQEAAYYLVAALFACWHQGKDRAESADGNLGSSLRALVDKENDPSKRENLEKSTEKRLNALLNAHRDDLPEHLRRIMGLLKSKDVPVNWAQLLADAQQWGRDDRTVQHEWAKGFWVLPRKKREEETQAETK